MSTEIQGIDISHHQGQVDHELVATSGGMSFCICKATEGRDHEDSMFEENIAEIRGVSERFQEGITYYPGAYHFARPDTDGGSAEDGRAEAEWFCDVVEQACGSIENNFMPPVLDFEKYSESDFNENIPWIQAWLDTVQARLKRQPMIYTGKNVWKYEVGNTDLFVAWPLWLVYYTAGSDQIPMESLPWGEWALWQYSASGSYQHAPPVPGAGIVDVNRFSGSLEDLAVFAKAHAAPPPLQPVWPPPPDIVNLYNLRGAYSNYTARVQGLLMAQGYGPDGLVGNNGLPDGLSGPKTEGYLLDFSAKCGLPQVRLTPDRSVVTWETWWMLTYFELRKS